MKNMRALTLKSYGSLKNFELTQITVPEPQKGEVRVRVVASAIGPADLKVCLGTFKFLHGRKFPMTLGYDFSGVIEGVGTEVTEYKAGDEVFGFLAYGPSNNQGAFCEQIIAKASDIAPKPKNVSHILAASAATSALTALQGIRDVAQLKPGGRVLVTGVSGAVGSTAILVAKNLGARVTAIGSGRGLELAKKLGAEEVIDRKKDNVFEKSQTQFDVIFDAAAAYRWKSFRHKLKKGGTYVTTLPSLAFATDKLTSLLSASRVGFVGVKSKGQDLKLLAQWLAVGFPVAVDSTVSLEQVPQGFERYQKGDFLGRIAVEVSKGAAL